MEEKTVAAEDTSFDQEYKVRTKKQKDTFHEKQCKVIHYNKRNKTLDIMFDRYGIRIKNVKEFEGACVTVKYKGEIGKPNFEVFL